MNKIKHALIGWLERLCTVILCIGWILLSMGKWLLVGLVSMITMPIDIILIILTLGGWDNSFTMKLWEKAGAVEITEE